MKKLSILFACLVASLAFISCEEDKDPQYHNPTKFDLNTPALASHYYELTEDGTIDLSWSQPDYGYAATALYKVQISLNESFEEFFECTTEYKTCAAQVKSKDLAEGICKLRGIENEDDYTDEPARKLYVRIHAYINGIEGSDILSNVITLESVKEYCAIQSPGYIYLIGNVGGWTGPDAGNAGALENWRLFESATAIGSKIYTGIFDMPAGELIFRFYTELTGWDGGASLGMQVEDNPVDIVLTDGQYAGALVAGKGSIRIADWEGGSMKITVNCNNNTITIEAGGVDTSNKAFIFLVGAPSGWTGPSADNAAHYEAFKLFDLEDNGVYTGTFTIKAGEAMFRFYTALTGWDADSFGSQAEDAPVDIALADGVYTGSAMAGKGSWNIPDWTEEGKLAISVDVPNGKVTFTKK